MVLILYLGHGVFNREQIFFSSHPFSGEVFISHIEEISEKLWCTSIVARVSDGLVPSTFNPFLDYCAEWFLFWQPPSYF